MARHYSPAWLTATPRHPAYGFRKMPGSLAMLAAMRRASAALDSRPVGQHANALADGIGPAWADFVAAVKILRAFSRSLPV
jgi:hypothetical protein